jgi:pantoate kinase
MASTPEGKVKQKIKNILSDLGIYYAMPMGTGYGNSGVPDFIGCANGRFIAIEAKTKGNVPTALQHKHMRLIESAGGITFVIDEQGVESLREYLTAVINKAPNA